MFKRLVKFIRSVDWELISSLLFVAGIFLTIGAQLHFVVLFIHQRMWLEATCAAISALYVLWTLVKGLHVASILGH